MIMVQKFVRIQIKFSRRIQTVVGHVACVERPKRASVHVPVVLAQGWRAIWYVVHRCLVRHRPTA
jgi:hypothetical protein